MRKKVRENEEKVIRGGEGRGTTFHFLGDFRQTRRFRRIGAAVSGNVVVTTRARPYYCSAGVPLPVAPRPATPSTFPPSLQRSSSTSVRRYFLFFNRPRRPRSVISNAPQFRPRIYSHLAKLDVNILV